MNKKTKRTVSMARWDLAQKWYDNQETPENTVEYQEQDKQKQGLGRVCVQLKIVQARFFTERRK